MSSTYSNSDGYCLLNGEVCYEVNCDTCPICISYKKDRYGDENKA